MRVVGLAMAMAKFTADHITVELLASGCRPMLARALAVKTANEMYAPWRRYDHTGTVQPPASVVQGDNRE